MRSTRQPDSLGTVKHGPGFAIWATVALLATGCGEARNPESHRSADSVVAEAEAAPTIEVGDLAAQLADRSCTVLDANTRPVRIRNGAIPGATLLSHYRDYSLGELPADKQRALVFYCANQRCTASDVAARRALAAGYANVRVLRSGIAGWANAGHATQPVPQNRPPQNRLRDNRPDRNTGTLTQ